MAKRYIPGISGLLTEPNPTDSPSNTLSEAENVVVEQRGKVQARHGFNLTDPVSTDVYISNPYEGIRRNLFQSLPSIPTLKRRSQLIGKIRLENILITETSVFRVLYLSYEDFGQFETYETDFLNDKIGFSVLDIKVEPRNEAYTLLEIINICNNAVIAAGLNLKTDLIFKNINNYLVIESDFYLEMYYTTDAIFTGDLDENFSFIFYPNLISLLGFDVKQNSYSEYVFDHFEVNYQIPGSNGLTQYQTGNYVKTTNYVADSLFNCKVFEFNNNTDKYLTGVLVKQKFNLFDIRSQRVTISKPFVGSIVENTIAETKFRYYYIDKDTSKILAQVELPFKSIDNVLLTNETMLLQTEDGLVESSLRDIFRPSTERFFKIRWPSYPEIRYSFRKSNQFSNWFYSGYKIGLRYTFYREMGYDDQEGIIYESEPSRIYEIFNDGEDSVLDIELVFNTVLEASELYKQYNEFTKLNNGRKFGIKLYRTDVVPILNDDGQANPLKTEYTQCYDLISFDTIFTTKLKYETSNSETEPDDYSIEYAGVLTRYQQNDTRGELNVGDVISYLPNNEENNTALEYIEGDKVESTTPLLNGYIYSQKNVQYNTSFTDPNDIKLAKLTVTDKFIANRTERDISEIDNYFPIENFEVYATSNGAIITVPLESNDIYNPGSTSFKGLFEDYDPSNVGIKMKIVGAGVAPNTYITQIISDQLNVYFYLNQTVNTNYNFFVKFRILPGPYDASHEYEINTNSNQKSENIGFTAYNAELFDKYINTVEFSLKTYSLFSSTQITIEVWEYEYLGNIESGSDPIKLIKRLSTHTVNDLQAVTTVADYISAENCVYNLDYLTGGENARLKLTLSQLVEWRSKTSLLFSISISDIVENPSIIFIASYIDPVRIRGNLSCVYELNKNIVTKWKDGDFPLRTDFLVPHESVISLSRTENVYHYNFQAANYITDEGYDLSRTFALNEGDNLKKDSASFPLDISIITNSFTLTDVYSGIMRATLYTNKSVIDVWDTRDIKLGDRFVFKPDTGIPSPFNAYTVYKVVSLDVLSRYVSKIELADEADPSLTPIISTEFESLDLVRSHDWKFKINNITAPVPNNLPVRFGSEGSTMEPLYSAWYGMFTGFYMDINNPDNIFYTHRGPVLQATVTQNSSLISVGAPVLKVKTYTRPSGFPVTPESFLDYLKIDDIFQFTTVTGTDDVNTTDLYRVVAVNTDSFQIALVTDVYRSPINFTSSGVLEVNPSIEDDEVRLKLTPDATAITQGIKVETSNYRLPTVTLFNHFTKYRAFIKNYKVSLEFGDYELRSIGSVLYTNSNAETFNHVNILAPNSNIITPFKDYYIYAGINLPLTASFTVVSPPAIEQVVLGLPLPGSIGTSIAENLYDIPESRRWFNATPITNTNTMTYINQFGNPDGRVRIGSILIPSVSNSSTVLNAFPSDVIVTKIEKNISNEWIITTTKSFTNWPTNGSNVPYDVLLIPTYTSYTFPILKSSKEFEFNLFDRHLFLESSIINDRRVEIETLSYENYSYAESTYGDTITDSTIGSIKINADLMEDFVPLILNNLSTTDAVSFPETKRYQFGATVFERPYLTLKLTSIDNEINYVAVQLTPFYNRKGYYPLTARNGEYDKNALQANDNVDALNYAQPTDSDITTLSAASIVRAGLVPGMVEGVDSGQAESDATVNFSSNTSITANSANAIYYNSTANTLTFNNITKFAKDVFKEPGMMLLQVINGTTVQAYAIIHYTNITTETNATNKHVFKNVVIKYISKLGVYTEPTTANFSSISGTLYNIWFMSGTTEENIPLYAYSDDQLSSIYINHNTTTVATINEYHNDSGSEQTYQYPVKPSLVFLPHKDYESPVVATLSKNGNILFKGAAFNDYTALLEDYTWSIIESINRELQNKDIPAYLRKGMNTGEIQIIYPNGKSIEILNGEYDPLTDSITGYGSHEFSPSFDKDAFTKLAVRNEKLQYVRNEIQWSRRKIPEIVTLASHFVLGKNTKAIIGAGQSVDDLYIFKEDGIFRLTDSGNVFGNSNIPALRESTYQFSTTSICVSGNSIQEINNEIIYLDQNGFMSIIDGGIQNISGAIQRDILTLIQTTPKDRIRSFKNESKSLYYCTLINEVDDTLDVKSGTYVFNTKTRQWTFMNEEILDGIEDYKHRNLAIYKQKETSLSIADQDADLTYTKYSIDEHKVDTTYDNFYITREQYTNNLWNNALDQYDWKSVFTYSPDAPYKSIAANSTELIISFLNVNTGQKNDLVRYNYNTLASAFFDDSVGSIINLLANRSITVVLTKDANQLTLTGRLTHIQQNRSGNSGIDYTITLDRPSSNDAVFNILN